MKKGDIVRFVSSGGGGVISGFKPNGIVLVEDEDGFEIPAMMNDVVVIEDANDKLLKGNTPAKSAQQLKESSKQFEGNQTVSADKPRMEYSAGNKLSVYLAFIPVDTDRLGHTSYEQYIVNDSNYHTFVTIAVADGRDWRLRHAEQLEPNSKLRVATLSMDDVAHMERLSVQVIAFKRDRAYEMKPSVDVQMRLDQVKFCKAGSFRKTDHFEEDAMLVTIIEGDKSARAHVVATDEMKREMYKDEVPAFTETQHPTPSATSSSTTNDPNAPIVIDLHADALLDTFQGLSAADILQYQLDTFHKHMHDHRKEIGRKLVFIHGKGEGRLRSCIIQQLQYRYKQCRYQDASFQEYGYGATMVTIK